MRFGCCGSTDDIWSISAAGYDFIELPVATVMPDAPKQDWEPIRKNIREFPIKPEAWNCLLPGDVKVTGPEADPKRQRAYLSTAFERISEVGGRVVVFGSGAARRVPEGFPMAKAKEQVIDFLHMVGDIAHEHALKVVIEPLNRAETNIILSVKEGLDYAERVNHPSVGVLADFYHIDEEHEPFANIVEAKHYLSHVHVADTGRLFPGSGSYDYPGFIAALRDAGYEKRVSCECGWGDDPDTARKSALDFLRGAFAAQ